MTIQERGIFSGLYKSGNFNFRIPAELSELCTDCDWRNGIACVMVSLCCGQVVGSSDGILIR